MSLVSDLLSRTVLNVRTGCMEWSGHIKDSGYGQVTTNAYGTRRAHRAMWQSINGPIPNGMCVCHKCDNKRCINPDHLFLGTFADNNKDRNTKGRSNPYRGHEHPNSKLTAQQVREIRSLNGVTQEAIARLYGVSRGAIDGVRSGRRWAHIK